MAYVEDVQVLVSRLTLSLERSKERLDADCYCAENSGDHQGPCDYCTTHRKIRQILREGEDILWAEPVLFLVQADDFVAKALEILR